MPRKKQNLPTEPKGNLCDSPELSPAQKASMLRIEERLNKKNRLKLTKSKDGGKLEIRETVPGMATIQAMEATGSADQDAANILIHQVAIAQPYPNDPLSANAAIAMLHGIEPQDELEGMLGVQMVAVHNLALEYARRAMTQNLSLDVSNSLISRTTKLMSVFTRQVEALQKYRTKGQQKITVQHVQVNEGGQAVIGDINQAGGGRGHGDKIE